MKNRDDLGPMASGGTVAATPLQAQDAPTYLFTFGDSYTQTDFTVDGTQPCISNPMGKPILATGTTSSGINWVEYLTTLYNASPVLSHNFAVIGATIDNSIVDSKVKDVTSQVRDFELAYSKKPISAPWSSDNAVFGFWIGINDIGRGHQNTQPSGPEAVKTHATWVRAYNSGLQSMISDFKSNHTDTTIVLYDTWSFMPKILDDPQAYGFPNATCFNKDGTSCIWWDHYHPGQNYHKLQAADMVQYLQPLGAW
ncbi:CAZyme family CE16 [Penicillium psychrosexuale]|uniref:CAZyme family CE16 n=1 Tax=Penicillium psychrosexuale TaxID=1002107 RepID=UPI002545354B|nr:CAZyme family CE16 [Penicillium psychrosexuale]KAJ5795763.1 CAZyme family CE16 [Penicillium psychrosexuale]